MTDKSLADKAIDFKGRPYVQVADRVLYFNETYPNGSITTEKTADVENYVEFKATVTPDCNFPNRTFTGHSQATWGEGFVNQTAALENAETSAVGRALALMGIGVIESIASLDEINKATSSPTKTIAISEKQIELIKSLKEQKGVTNEILMDNGFTDLAHLTGGKDGTASEVITFLMNWRG